MADSFNDWARLILEDFEVLTGYPLAVQWQQRNGAISFRDILMPKRYFVLGGEYTIDNLSSMDAIESLIQRAVRNKGSSRLFYVGAHDIVPVCLDHFA